MTSTLRLAPPEDALKKSVWDRAMTIPGLPMEAPRDWRDRVTKGGRTLSVLVRTVVRMGNERVEGEVEPQHDGAYERCSIRLRRDGDGDVVNANAFSFRCSVDWPGPLVAFLVHDPDGKAIAKARFTPLAVKAGMELSVDEGKIFFESVEK